MRMSMSRGKVKEWLLHAFLFVVCPLVCLPFLLDPALTLAERAGWSWSVPSSSSMVGVQRINQLDPAQYASQEEYAAWWPSACSAASMAEILNAYGGQYRITDVLSIERNIGAISVHGGLLGDGQIERTMNQFHFSVAWGYSLTLDQVIAQANQGRPVIVSFPPSRWAGGHLLVVVGGNDATVQVVDSSSFNMKTLTRSRFLGWWAGFSAIATPGVNTSGSSVVGGPSLSANFINQVLVAAGSPAQGTGQALYDESVRSGIDDAYALAFFRNESSFGKAGWGAANHSLGNIRCTSGYACGGGYRAYASWEDGFRDWYQLIRGMYVNQLGLTTVEQIIPVYAPAADHNDESAYINVVESSVALWRAGQVS